MSGEISEELVSLIERYEKAPDSRLFAPLADAYRKSGDLDRAIEVCEKGLKAYPEYASAHVILGKCFYDKGATERARAEFLRVLELDPENMVALKFMGDILHAEDKHEEAAEYFRKLLAVDPTNDEVSKSVKEMEMEFRVKEIDLEDDTTARKVERPRELATMTLAGIYAAQGYYNKALKIYHDIIRDQPDNKEALEMVDKLQAIMDESEKERDRAFVDEVQTLSIDEVSEEVVGSTAGSGVGEARVEPVDRPEEEVKEEVEVEEVKPAVEEKVERQGEPEEEEAPSKGLEGFQAWIEKLKRDREDR